MAATGPADPNNRNEKVIFKNCAPFTNFEINNKEIDHAKDIDVVVPMCNLMSTVTIIRKHLEVYDNTI